MSKKITLTSQVTIQPRAKASKDNPFIREINFTITDDKPNANLMGIKKDSFFGFAKSGVFMPIKMSFGAVNDHETSFPLGVITETVVEEDRVTGAGVLWPEERPDDISLVEQKVFAKDAFLSWEIAYTDEHIDESGIVWITDPILTAVTLVSDPAYGNRTPVHSIASTQKEDDMPDNKKEDVELQEDKVQEKTEPETPETEIPKTEESPTEEPAVDEALIKELEDLRAYKESIEKEKLFEERRARVTEVLGNEIEEDDVKILTELSDDQLNVVKKILASKKKRGNSSTIPEITPGKPKSELDLLKMYLHGGK